MKRLAIVTGLVLSCAAGAAAPRAAHAQQPQSTDDEARYHYRLGRAAYESGHFEEAAEQFDAAYRLSQRPQLLYNIFVSRRDAGQLGPAIEALRRYLELVPDAQDREQLASRLRTMERLHAEQGDTGATSSSGTSSAGGEPARSPGDRPIADDTIESSSGASVAGGGPGGAPSDAGGGGGSIVPWIVAGAGGALVLGGVITGIMALGAESDLEEMCQPVDHCPVGWEDTRDRGATLAVVTDVLLVLGVAAIGTGVALFFLMGDEREESPTHASLSCGPSGCMGTLRLDL